MGSENEIDNVIGFGQDGRNLQLWLQALRQACFAVEFIAETFVDEDEDGKLFGECLRHPELWNEVRSELKVLEEMVSACRSLVGESEHSETDENLESEEG